MQGRSDDQRELLDAESVAGHLLKADSVFGFLAAHRRELFPEEMFADLFPSGRGRPSVPAEVMASVITLQALHGLSDSETVDAVTYDLRWKAACGLPITAAAFHSTTLTYWRRRLAASRRPDRIFEAVKTVIAETGVLTGKTRRALDSTILDDAVATQDTVTQLIGAIRRVRREVPGAVVVITSQCSAHDYDDPGKPRIAWNDAQARETLVDALVSDAHRLLGHLPEQELDAKAADAVALLALIAGQDVEPVEGSDGTDGRWRIARRVAPDRVISTVDPDARHAHKTVHRRQDGFKAHIAIEPDTGIITDCVLTKASGTGSGEAAVGIDLLAQESEPVTVLADSAYGSGNCAPRSSASATAIGSNPHPCARRCRADSPLMTSPSTMPTAWRRVLPGCAAPSAPPGLRRSGRHAGDVAYASDAPPAPRARRWQYDPMTSCNATHAWQPETWTGSTNIVSTGQWWNARSRGWLAGTAKCATAASSRTTIGCTTAPQRSICAD